MVLAAFILVVSTTLFVFYVGTTIHKILRHATHGH